MFFLNCNLEAGGFQNTVIEKVTKGETAEIFQLNFFQQLIRTLSEQDDSEFPQKLQTYVENQIKLCDTEQKQLEIVAIGIASLIVFIEKNWVDSDILITEAIKKVSDHCPKSVILRELVVDGENVVSVIEFPELLYLSKVILNKTYSVFKNLSIGKVWYLRCLFINQQILDELSPILFDNISSIISEIQNLQDSLPEAVIVALHLEFARIFLYYDNVLKSQINIDKALEISGTEISFSGALGKRTKFQVKDLAQLIVKIHTDSKNKLWEGQGIEQSVCALPVDLKLNDDVRLDKIVYNDSSLTQNPNLTPLHQAVLLGILFQIQKSQPKDSLAEEELQPLINCILEDPKSWAIRTTCLLMRSRLESKHKRTVERSMMQMQVLVDGMKDTNISINQRLMYFFVSYLPPKWEIKSILANILTSMGSVKSALEIYLNLEDWENVIYCYNILQLRHKAKEIIEQELKKKATPKLWCLLGDATDDVTCYERAWKLSNEKSARSQRHWALFYYCRQDYAQSIEHFQKSLEINSLQKEMWYKLGYAALMVENWEISATAYRRYVVLEPECFEAWNNLGRCYSELKQIDRAWRAIKEALKVDFSNWRVWDNYMLLSVELKMFDDVIHSYHKILDLKEKHLDIPVLKSLVAGYKIIENNDENIEYLCKFRNKLLELFGRLTSQVINNSELWFLYSEIVGTKSPENLFKKQQLLMKAHRSAVNTVGWEKKIENCDRVVYILSKLVEIGLIINKPDTLQSCKFAATGTVATIKKAYPDVDICKDLEENLAKLENMSCGEEK